MNQEWDCSWYVKGSVPDSVMKTIRANLVYDKGSFRKYDAHISIRQHGSLSFLGIPDYTVVALKRITGGAPPAIMAEYLKHEIGELLREKVIMTCLDAPGLDTYLS